MSSLKLSFVIEAIDRATSRVTAVNRAIDKITEPARRVRAAFNSLVRESGITKLGEQWEGVTRRFGRVREIVGSIRNNLLGAAAAGGALFFGMSKVAGRMDKLADDAKMLNVSIEWLQEMGQASEQAGGSVDGMTDALRFLSKNMAEAVTGGKEQAEWFARVGIPLDKLKKMTLPQVFGQIADKFNQVGDAGTNAQKKIAVTQALMGRGGYEMVQFLSKGGKGIAEIVAALRNAGTIVDKDTAESLADFNDTLALLRGNLFATLAVIAKAALPVFERFTKVVIGASQGNRELMATRVGEWADRVAARLPSIVSGLSRIASGVVAAIGTLDNIALAMGGWGNVIKVVAALMVLKLVVAISALAVALAGLWPTIIMIGAALSTVLLPVLADILAGFAWMAGATISIVASWLAVVIQGAFTFASTVVMALVGGLGAVAAAVWTLTAALLSNPITWIVLAIAGAAFLLYKYWGPISAFFKELWTRVSNVFSAGWDAVAGVVEAGSALAVGLAVTAWTKLGDFFSGLWGGIKAGFDTVFDWIAQKVQAVAGMVAGAVTKLAGLLPAPLRDAISPAGAPQGGGPGVPPSVFAPAAGPVAATGGRFGAATAPGGLGPAAGSAIGGRGAPAAAKIGGTLKITIDQNGKAKVAELRSDNPDVNIDVFTGSYMHGT